MDRFSKNLPIERMHAAREDGQIVGGAGAFPFEMTVPGGVVPTAGVTVVGRTPTHRRRGVLRAMMRAQLDDVHERGEPVALLWASEETIYGRFGYGMASLVGEMALPRASSAFAHPLEREGTVRLVEQAEALQLFPRVWDKVRRGVPGMLARSRNWWELRILFEGPSPGSDQGPKRYVVLERGGRPEGYAIYRHKPKWEGGVSDSELEVVEAVGHGRPADCGALALPVRHRLGGRDHRAAPARRPRALPAPRDAETHALPGGRRALGAPRRRRGGALGARLRRRTAAVVFDVVDAFCPWNEGRWRLASGTAKRSRTAPQLRLRRQRARRGLPRRLHVRGSSRGRVASRS